MPSLSALARFLLAAVAIAPVLARPDGASPNRRPYRRLHRGQTGFKLAFHQTPPGYVPSVFEARASSKQEFRPTRTSLFGNKPLVSDTEDSPCKPQRECNENDLKYR